MAELVFAGANAADPAAPATLTASELIGVDLHGCELAVLSACLTNVGNRPLGDALAGLARALQTAGARNSITSLWQVSDAATGELFDAFYRRWWKEGQPVAEAFHGAQLDVRAAGHGPEVWAAFVLYTTGAD